MKQRALLLTIFACLCIGAFVIFVSSRRITSSALERETVSTQNQTSSTNSSTTVEKIQETPSQTGHESPLKNAASRITKKHFGTFVTPKNSPVSPEKFQGFHTGIDFEAFEDEQSTEVSVYTICGGKVRQIRSINGYGGVLIQDCMLDGEAVTVLYGHLRQTSIQQKAGDILKAGDEIGLLGKGYSTETSGERKHLHLSIHRGSAINVRGYVQSKTELDAWQDPEPFIVSGH